ncbi:MAG: primosome assembly protein PriA, partial [Frankiales bacterium]|nr:primosome assembly protein PriA [Frankiales bacterium]
MADPETLALPGLERRTRPARSVRALAGTAPVARVAVDSGLAHLDRPFDYAVPAEMDEQARPGCRVRVRFAGRLVDGVLLERATTSEGERALSPLASVVSPEPVLGPEVLGLARAAADRW